MKRIILTLSVIALLASCVDKGAYILQGTLSGKAEMPDSTKVYLYEDGKATVVLDSTLLVGGKFEFKGSQLEPVIRYLGIQITERPMRTPIVIEPGNISFNLADNIVITGTPLNDVKNVYDTSSREANQQLRNLSQEIQALELTDPKRDELIAKYSEMREEMSTKLTDFIKGNLSNPVGALYFASSVNGFELDKMKELMAIVPETAKSNKHIIQITDKIEILDAVQVGKKFVDIKGKTLDGKDTSLADYAGKDKIVLLDFWASWCGPCIMEIPHMKAAYAKYKEKGFEIVGVSLDRDQEEWQEGTTKHDITWPQFSNLKFWEEPGAATYGVSGIPHTVLIDKDGTIIEKNLRGDALSKKLEELLK